MQRSSLQAGGKLGGSLQRNDEVITQKNDGLFNQPNFWGRKCVMWRLLYR